MVKLLCDLNIKEKIVLPIRNKIIISTNNDIFLNIIISIFESKTKLTSYGARNRVIGPRVASGRPSLPRIAVGIYEAIWYVLTTQPPFKP